MSTTHFAAMDALQKSVLLKLHADGYTDDKENCKVMQQWLEQLKEVVTSGKATGNKLLDEAYTRSCQLANHCHSLQGYVQEYRKEISDALEKLNASISAECKRNESQVLNIEDNFGASASIVLLDTNSVESIEMEINSEAAALLSHPVFKNPSQNTIAVTNEKQSTGKLSPFAMLRWIVSLSNAESPMQYTLTQIRQILLKADKMLEAMCDKMRVDVAWVKTTFEKGCDVAKLIDSVVGAFIYSVDAKDCECTSIEQCLHKQLEESVGKGTKHRKNPRPPSIQGVFGRNGSHWAMLNSVLRVAGDPSGVSELDRQSQAALEKAIAFFEPLRQSLDFCLQSMPKCPRVVFRGVEIPLASKYSLGSEVCCHAFTSTSLVGAEALKFMKSGGTYFVISTHSGALIEDFSHYPEQAEALMATGSEFEVTSKMSRTLQQIIGNDFDVVFMAEKNSTLSDRETIKQLVDGTRMTEFVYATYEKVYVEARLSSKRPSSVTGAVSAYPLTKVVDYFIKASSAPYMLLLGEGGAGKTSAEVGCLCHLMRFKGVLSKPILPVFISLPSIGPALYEPGGLDRHLQHQLRLTDSAFALLHAETHLVVLLDSLDEVTPQSNDLSSTNIVVGSSTSLIHDGAKKSTKTTATHILSVKLLEQNPFCAKAKVIVSCRTEFLDEANCNPSEVLSFDKSHTAVYHICPFSTQDRQAFLKQAAAERIEQLAQREADHQYDVLQQEFGLTDAELHHPCLLRIATTVVERETIEEEKVQFRNRFTLYDSFVRQAVHGCSSVDFTAIMQGIKHIAMFMAERNTWQIPVREIRQQLSNVLQESDSVIIDSVLAALPARCEDLYNSEAMWSFWHKTVTEFLVALSLVSSTDSTGDELKRQLIESHPGIASFAVDGEKANSAFCPTSLSELELDDAKLAKIRVLNLSNMEHATWKEVEPHVLKCVLLESFTLPRMEAETHVSAKFKGFQKLEQLKLLNMKDAWVNAVKVDKFAFQVPNAEVLFPKFTTVINVRVSKCIATIVDMKYSFPHCQNISDNFCEGSKIGKLMLPTSFASIVTIPNKFLQGIKINVLDLSSCFAKAAKIGEGFCCKAHVEHLSLPTSFSKMECIPDSFLEGIKTSVLDFTSCFGKVTKIGESFCSSAVVEQLKLPTSFASIECVPDSFLDGIKTSVLDLSNCFGKATTIGECFCCEGQVEQLKLPTFASVECVHDNFLQGINTGVLDLSNCFGKTTKIGEGFCSSAVVEQLKLPASFTSVECIPATFLEGIKTSVLDLSNCFGKATEIGKHFCREAQVEQLKLPTFASVERISWGFLEGIKTSVLDLSNCFGKATNITADFCREAQVGQLKLQDSFASIKCIPEYFLQRIKTGVLDLRNCFGKATAIGEGFCCKAQVEQLKLPTFASIKWIPDNFLVGIKANVLDLSNCCGEATMIGEGFCSEAQVEQLKLPSFSSVERIPELFLEGIKTSVLDLSNCFGNATEIGQRFCYKAQVEQLKPPTFALIKCTPANFLVGIKANVLDLSNCCGEATAIGEGFCFEAQVEELKLPSFASVESIPEGFLEGIKVSVLDLSNCFGNATKIGERFCWEAQVEHLKLPTSFGSIKCTPDNFLVGIKTIVLDLSSCFGNATTIGEGFCCEAQVGQLKLPSFASVECISEGFLEGIKTGVLDLSNCFGKVTAVPEDFCTGARVEQLRLPPFASVDFIAEHFLSEIKAKELDLSNCFPAASEMGEGFCSEAQIEKLQLPGSLKSLFGSKANPPFEGAQIQTLDVSQCWKTDEEAPQWVRQLKCGTM